MASSSVLEQEARDRDKTKRDNFGCDFCGRLVSHAFLGKCCTPECALTYYKDSPSCRDFVVTFLLRDGRPMPFELPARRKNQHPHDYWTFVFVDNNLYAHDDTRRRLLMEYIESNQPRCHVVHSSKKNSR